MNIKPIKQSVLKAHPFLRVAVYARVSSNNLEMQNSLFAQVDYYSNLIKSHVDWELAGLFVDKGLSGTKADRTEFNKMLELARNGGIDLILTKSITRFARNTLTLLNTIRELKDLNVDVFFEEENLHIISETGEVILTLLAMKAEEEARTYSDLAKLSLKKRYENGNYLHGHTYGYKVVDGKYEIMPEEAKIVRRIFDEFIAGKPIGTIARDLNRDGLYKSNTRGMLGAKRKDAPKRLWRDNTVQVIIENEKYTGNVLLQKSYTTDFRTKDRKKNSGELTQYYIAEEHPAIISVETFEKASEEMARRKALPKPRHDYDIPNLFLGILFCGNCGSRYQRRLHQKNGKYRYSYNCSHSINTFDNHCRMPRLRESVLVKQTKAVLGLPEEAKLTKGLIENQIIRIEVIPDEKLKYYLTSGATVTSCWHYERKDSWGDEWKPLPERKENI
ncbi:recombinase family protein [Candidatus Saccharibacteria bacterium]|nr:recombinase family protein [Candidatus Saccharibacteria bacterium]